MSKIVIVTDSASDIDPSLREELHLEVVPLQVLFGSESYMDGVTITSAEFFEKLASSTIFPTTSQPSPVEFVEKFKEIISKHGKDVQIIAILISSALSGTYQSAVIGKSMLEEDADITVIDSKKASFIEGLIVVEAAKAVQAGQSKEQVIELIEYMIRDMKEFFIVDTLTYLQKGGRIGKASALIGSLLNIKPILSLEPTGGVYSFDKVRGIKKGITRILEELKAYAGDAPVKLAVIHASSEEEANALVDLVKSECNVVQSYTSGIGPVIGAHVGPGAFAFIMVKA